MSTDKHPLHDTKGVCAPKEMSNQEAISFTHGYKAGYEDGINDALKKIEKSFENISKTIENLKSEGE